MLPGGVAFAFQVLGSIDAALRANRMRTLDRQACCLFSKSSCAKPTLLLFTSGTTRNSPKPSSLWRVDTQPHCDLNCLVKFGRYAVLALAGKSGDLLFMRTGAQFPT